MPEPGGIILRCMHLIFQRSVFVSHKARRIRDYKVIFGDVGLATSTDTTVSGRRFLAKAVNFKVVNTTHNTDVRFLFGENDGSDGKLSIDSTTGNVDAVYFLEQGSIRQEHLYLAIPAQPQREKKPAGRRHSHDCSLNKPFLSYDTYRFTMKGSTISNTKATK